VSSLGNASISNFVDVIENDASCSLQKSFSTFFFSDFNSLRNLVAVDLLQTFNNSLSSFDSSTLSLHGIEYDSSIFVEADPVIGEDGVRFVGFKSVSEDSDFDTLFFEDRNLVVKLLTIFLLNAFKLELLTVMKALS